METPFACSICHKAFSQLQTLGTHVQNAHILKKSGIEEKTNANQTEEVINEENDIEIDQNESNTSEDTIILCENQADKEEDQTNVDG